MTKQQPGLLDRLEAIKRNHGGDAGRACEALLGELRGFFYPDAQSLIAAHDALLFLRAFPQSHKVAKLADARLQELPPQATRLAAEADNSAVFDDEAVSGIAGTELANEWTFELARWLVKRHPGEITVAMNAEERYRQMATVLPQCMPLLADDAYVEADTPYSDWLRTAAGSEPAEAAWLIKAFAALPVTPRVRTSLYDSLGATLQWRLGKSAASRTLARWPVKELFAHQAPLLQRKQVSLLDEMHSPPLAVRALDRKEAEAAIDMARDVLAVRYRELQGTTFADAGHAFEVEAGRGVQLFLWGLDAEWRLPLRGYYAGFTLKNGVPINYFEAIGLCEWMEVGFNTFYAFREGETAWVYSKVLHALHQLAKVSCFSVYPYQIGQDNEEAIQSGAFWFYRKLGFRPGRPDLLALTEREERRMAVDPTHRTSARTLRKLAEGHMFFEFGEACVGRWDSFSTRKLGMAVQQRIAADFGGDAVAARKQAVKFLQKALGVTTSSWKPLEQAAFANFAITLLREAGISRWSNAEKQLLVQIIRAKGASDETRYLRLTQRHGRLREALVRMGSAVS